MTLKFIESKMIVVEVQYPELKSTHLMPSISTSFSPVRKTLAAFGGGGGGGGQIRLAKVDCAVYK